MKILHVAPSFYPAIGWGGPIFSTKAICDGTAALPGADISVLTTDAAGPKLDERLKTGGQTIRLAEGYDVHYARRIAGHSISPGLLARLPRAVWRADVVHLTATYNFPTLFTLLIARILGKPVVWSPRGALQATSEWRDAPNVRLKHAFERLAQLFRPRRTVLLVTARQEGQASTERLAGIDVRIVPNGVDIPDSVKEYSAARRGTRLIFLGRLHIKKGIEQLIDAMRTLPETFELDIYGDGEIAYVDGLRQKAADLGRRVRFRGVVTGANKTAAFQKADIFVLPSHSENFGIAVAESLAAGTPVITSTNTPWEEINTVDCGRCINMGTTALDKTIRELAREDLKRMGAAGRDWMQRAFSNAALSSRVWHIYASLISDGKGGAS